MQYDTTDQKFLRRRLHPEALHSSYVAFMSLWFLISKLVFCFSFLLFVSLERTIL